MSKKTWHCGDRSVRNGNEWISFSGQRVKRRRGSKVARVAVSAAWEGGLSHERCEVILADIYSGIAGLGSRERVAEDDTDGVDLPAGFAADFFSCIKRVAELHARLVVHGAFRDIELSLFKTLLQCLGQADIVEQIATGELILGLEGERIRSGRDFYAAFQTPAEFTVTTGQRLIGTLPILVSPSADDHILLGGRPWKVVSVDYDRSEILVEPARGKKRPLFMGGPGAVHGRIRERMQEVLQADGQYVYLNSTAADLLAHARRTAEESRMLTDPVVAMEDRKSLWFTWAGSKTQSTLAAMLGTIGVDVIDRGVGLELTLPKSEIGMAVAKIVSTNPDADRVAGHILPKLRRKYDEFLSDRPLDTAIVRDILNLDEAGRLCRNLTQAAERPGEKGATNMSDRPADVQTPPIRGRRPLTELRSYLVFDFETTGMDSHHDRIIQIGPCRVTEGEVVDHRRTHRDRRSSADTLLKDVGTAETVRRLHREARRNVRDSGQQGRTQIHPAVPAGLHRQQTGHTVDPFGAGVRQDPEPADADSRRAPGVVR